MERRCFVWRTMIKAGVTRLRLIGIIEHRIAMPFSAHTSSITGILQELWQGDLLASHVNQLTAVLTRLGGIRLGFRNPIVDACSVGTPACHESDSRGRADGSGAVTTRKSQSVCGELIEIRCLNMRMAVTTQIAHPRSSHRTTRKFGRFASEAIAFAVATAVPRTTKKNREWRSLFSYDLS